MYLYKRDLLHIRVYLYKRSLLNIRVYLYKRSLLNIRVYTRQIYVMKKSGEAVGEQLPEPCPYIFERLRIWPFPTVRSVGRVVYTFSGRTLCQLAHQKDDYQSAILIIVFFGPAKSFIVRKDRGWARVVACVLLVTSIRGDL